MAIVIFNNLPCNRSKTLICIAFSNNDRWLHKRLVVQLRGMPTHKMMATAWSLAQRLRGPPCAVELMLKLVYRCDIGRHKTPPLLTPVFTEMSAFRPTIPFQMPLLPAEECPVDMLAVWNDDEVRLLSLLLLTPRSSEIEIENTGPLEEPVKELSVVSESIEPIEHRPATRAKRSRAAMSTSTPKRRKTRAPIEKSHLGFKTLTSTQCLQHIHKSFQLLTEAKHSLGKHNDLHEESVKSLNGWQLRCTSPSDPALNKRHLAAPFYMLSKRCKRHTVQEFMHRTWQLWTDPPALMRMLPSHEIELQVLQRFNGDGLIIRKDWIESGPAWGVQKRQSIYMLFRIETKQGFTLCARSLESIGMEFTPVFHWITFFAEEDTDEVQVEFASSLSAPPMPLPPPAGTSPQLGLRAALKPAISRDLWALMQWEQLMAEPPSPQSTRSS